MVGVVRLATKINTDSNKLTIKQQVRVKADDILVQQWSRFIWNLPVKTIWNGSSFMDWGRGLNTV